MKWFWVFFSTFFFRCPTDYVEFFDGNNPLKAPSIGGRFCGEQNDTQIYSTDSTLTLIFVTKSSINEMTYSRYRGFHVVYEFWDKFVQIEPELKSQHIRGTGEFCWFFFCHSKNHIQFRLLYDPINSAKNFGVLKWL